MHEHPDIPCRVFITDNKWSLAAVRLIDSIFKKNSGWTRRRTDRSNYR